MIFLVKEENEVIMVVFFNKRKILSDLDSSSKLVNWIIASRGIVLSELLILESTNDRSAASNEIILTNTYL